MLLQMKTRGEKSQAVSTPAERFPTPAANWRGPAGAVPNLGFLARGGGVAAAPGLPRGDAGERFLLLLPSAVPDLMGLRCTSYWACS